MEVDVDDKKHMIDHFLQYQDRLLGRVDELLGSGAEDVLLADLEVHEVVSVVLVFDVGSLKHEILI